MTARKAVSWRRQRTLRLVWAAWTAPRPHAPPAVARQSAVARSAFGVAVCLNVVTGHEQLIQYLTLARELKAICSPCMRAVATAWHEADGATLVDLDLSSFDSVHS